MSSLVVDVLATTGEIETAKIKEKINDIQKEIEKLKNDVKEFIKDNYIDFVPRLTKDPVLIEHAEKLISEIQTLKIRIDTQIKVELSGSTKELKNLSRSLEESNISLQLSSQLLDLNDSLKQFNKYEEDKCYFESAKILEKIEQILNKPNCDLSQLNLYSPLRDNYSQINSTFLTKISLLWEQQVAWNKTIHHHDQEAFSLTIKSDKNDLQDLIKALYYVNNLPLCLHSFSNKLMKNFITPIIHSNCSVFVVENNAYHVKILNKNEKPSYQSVLHNLKLLFQFIDQHLNCDIEDDCFLGLLRQHLMKQLSDDLLNNCIADTIPSSSSELLDFKPVEDNIYDVEGYLVDIGFISDNDRFLTSYIKDVDKLYVEKICQGHLYTAREIMKKDLHDSFKYTPDEDVELLEDNLSNCYVTKINNKLDKNTFQLPTCYISKSTKEILDLSRSILEEALISNDLCAVKLYYTSRNIFEMYIGVVPEYHKKFLETIPQQVALFHNNCMYLAHHLMTLAYEYRDKIPECLMKHNITYVDLTIKFRSVGSEYFLNHMKYQKNIITDILRDSELSQLGQSSELPPSTERALRQCIRQLELLKKVWSDVLPENIYCKALGCITNSMIEDLVTRVTTLEDIPASIATELVTLFNVVVKRAPSIFTEENSINRFVGKWQKLLELIKMLEASLKDIEDRWADGKGPLAHEFTSTQVKHLIRALFQNTERRAALLSIIK